MTEPQVWTLIGVFTALMFGMLTVVSTLFIQVVRSEIGGLRSEIRGIHTRIDTLERDMQAVVKHIFGIDRS